MPGTKKKTGIFRNLGSKIGVGFVKLASGGLFIGGAALTGASIASDLKQNGAPKSFDDLVGLAYKGSLAAAFLGATGSSMSDGFLSGAGKMGKWAMLSSAGYLLAQGAEGIVKAYDGTGSNIIISREQLQQKVDRSKDAYVQSVDALFQDKSGSNPQQESDLGW